MCGIMLTPNHHHLSEYIFHSLFPLLLSILCCYTHLYVNRVFMVVPLEKKYTNVLIWFFFWHSDLRCWLKNRDITAGNKKSLCSKKIGIFAVEIGQLLGQWTFRQKLSFFWFNFYSIRQIFSYAADFMYEGMRKSFVDEVKKKWKVEIVSNVEEQAPTLCCASMTCRKVWKFS